MIRYYLIGEKETIECPECEKEYTGAKSFERHVTQSHGGSDDSTKPPCEYFTKQDIYDEIAESTTQRVAEW